MVILWWKMTIEMVDLPIEHGWIFHSHVNVYHEIYLKLPGKIEKEDISMFYTCSIYIMHLANNGRYMVDIYG